MKINFSNNKIKKQDIKQVEKIKVELGKKDLEKKKLAKQIMEKINNKILTIKKLITENKDLYGSIKPTEISKLINENEKIDIIIIFQYDNYIKS